MGGGGVGRSVSAGNTPAKPMKKNVKAKIIQSQSFLAS
jgi:hypothetical protein